MPTRTQRWFDSLQRQNRILQVLKERVGKDEVEAFRRKVQMVRVAHLEFNVRQARGRGSFPRLLHLRPFAVQAQSPAPR